MKIMCSSTCFSLDELEPIDGDAEDDEDNDGDSDDDGEDDGDEVAEPVLGLQGM